MTASDKPMRDRLIKASTEALLKEAGPMSPRLYDFHDGKIRVDGTIEPSKVVDAILKELRRADDAMLVAGANLFWRAVELEAGDPDDPDYSAADFAPETHELFAAMIDVIRGQAPTRSTPDQVRGDGEGAAKQRRVAAKVPSDRAP